MVPSEISVYMSDNFFNGIAFALKVRGFLRVAFQGSLMATFIQRKPTILRISCDGGVAMTDGYV